MQPSRMGDLNPRGPDSILLGRSAHICERLAHNPHSSLGDQLTESGASTKVYAGISNR